MVEHLNGTREGRSVGESSKLETVSASLKGEAVLEHATRLIALRPSLADAIAGQLVCVACGTLSAVCYTTCRGARALQSFVCFKTFVCRKRA